MSTGVPFLFFVALMAAGQAVTKEVFEWAFSVPDMVRASAEMGRFLNDIASYKRRKNMKDVASTVECYMKEHGATGEEAVAAQWWSKRGGGSTEPTWRWTARLSRQHDCCLT